MLILSTPYYNLDYLDNILDDIVEFTIYNAAFLEKLLLRMWCESIKFASYRKKQQNTFERKLKEKISLIENNQDLESFELLEQKK